jgi:hypothetical protein
MTDKVISDDYIGPHNIHGIGTFLFIDRWLRPERPAERDYACDGEHYCNQDMAPGMRGYSPNNEIPFVTQFVDSTKETIIRGRFYVSDISPELTGMALKLSRIGSPGNLVVQLGSQEGGADLGELQLSEQNVESSDDLWYDLKLNKPIRLNPDKLYWFQVTVASGTTPHDGYVVYGPKPLGGTDYPDKFGLSFRMMTDGTF